MNYLDNSSNVTSLTAAQNNGQQLIPYYGLYYTNNAQGVYGQSSAYTNSIYDSP